MKNICESRSTDYSLSEGQKTILDIFRITVALFVLFGHGFSFFQCTIFKDQSYFPYIQNIGVVLFFLISGFLTTYSLEKNNNNHNLKRLKQSAIEIMPGVITKLLKRLHNEFPDLPIICGGLIDDKNEIIDALKHGAMAVSTSKKELW